METPNKGAIIMTDPIPEQHQEPTGDGEESVKNDPPNNGKFIILWSTASALAFLLVCASLAQLYRESSVQRVYIERTSLTREEEFVQEAAALTPREICKCVGSAFKGQTSGQKRSKFLGWRSSCSIKTNLAGHKVVSFTYFVGAFNGTAGTRSVMYQEMEENIKRLRSNYPGYFIRLYSDVSLTHADNGSQLCQIVCDNKRDVFFCPLQPSQTEAGKINSDSENTGRFLQLDDLTTQKILAPTERRSQILKRIAKLRGGEASR